jgi:hypothetical protein
MATAVTEREVADAAQTLLLGLGHQTDQLHFFDSYLEDEDIKRHAFERLSLRLVHFSNGAYLALFSFQPTAISPCDTSTVKKKTPPSTACQNAPFRAQINTPAGKRQTA